MNSRTWTLATRGFVVASLVAFSLFGYGCGGNDSATLSAQFTASTTPATARLVKLLPQAASGSRVVVQAVIYGPDVTLDMYSFKFDVTIGDTNVLQFVSGSAVAGGALTAFAGQTVQATAEVDASDPSHIKVDVHKAGGGAGNGVPGNSSVIVLLAFDALMPGTSTLAIAGAPAPTVTDQNGAAIGTITFDPASGSVTGISSGGGPY